MLTVLKTPAGEMTFDLPQPGDFRPFFLFAMHKSGSTLLNRMMYQALSAAGVPQHALVAREIIVPM
jgi:hypothetical protein